MKKNRVWLVSLFLFAAGCTSYSFRGVHPSVPAQGATGAPCKYRIKNYSCDFMGQAMPNPWSIPRFVGPSVDKTAIQRSLERKFPDLFSDEDDSVSLDVDVSFTGGNADYWGLVPYFAFLGVVPSRIVWYKDRCEIRTAISDDKSARARRSDIGFSSKAWLSVWTPFGLMMSDSPGQYNGECRSGYGVMTAPHLNGTCLQDEKDVFSATVAAGIVACIGKMDQSDLQRRAILNSLK